ncbi:hypothetical protein [Burkholderia pseudomallei]|uniref:hypothetical protein n=1 Tax=Burkholderia pseudomallei TaxID=28450 RepID=UPI0012B179E7|nr:hypothetical protein [Burkholderia pseudomallei]
MKVHADNLEVSQRLVKKHLNHALEISCCNATMDIYENRRRWLQYWIEHDFDGDRTAVERATGYSRSQLSQFLSKKYQDGKSIQERAARKIEEKFGKAERIMEAPAPTADRAPLSPTLLHKNDVAGGTPTANSGNTEEVVNPSSPDSYLRVNNDLKQNAQRFADELLGAVAEGRVKEETLDALISVFRLGIAAETRGTEHLSMTPRARRGSRKRGTGT